jgi:hypothetical protein
MKSYLIESNERLTDATKEALKKVLIQLTENGQVKGFNLFEVPTTDPTPICSLGVVE